MKKSSSLLKSAPRRLTSWTLVKIDSDRKLYTTLYENPTDSKIPTCIYTMTQPTTAPVTLKAHTVNSSESDRFVQKRMISLQMASKWLHTT